MKSGKDIEALKRRLAEAEENLRLVHGRKSQFVQEVDIPLQLIKDEGRLEREIEVLQARLAQVEAALTIPAVGDDSELSIIWQQRLRNLTDHIAQDLALLKEYEDALRYEDDPRRRVKYLREIKRLRESATHYQREYDQLRAHVIGEPPAALQSLATQLQHIDAKLDTLRKIPMIRLPLRVVLPFNLVVVVVLALVLGPRVSASLPCISPLASALSLAFILLLLFHLAWRYLGPAIRGATDSIEVGPVAVPIKVFVSLSDALHPWILSDRAPWVMVIILSLFAGILGLSLSPLSPFPLPTEETPIVQSFSVQYLDRDEVTASFKPGGVVEISAGELVLVQAETLGQDGVLCSWSAAGGSLQSAGGCATLYSAPFSGARDGLDILAQSPCKTQSASASLHITVLLSDQ